MAHDTRLFPQFETSLLFHQMEEQRCHIVTDTMGLLLAVVVHAANVHDSKGASDVIALLKGWSRSLLMVVIVENS